MRGERLKRSVAFFLCVCAHTSHLTPHTLFAGQLPSLFRGVVVADPADGEADNPIGIRVVSVEASSQAFLADLRPEDIIVQINDTPIRSIDEFAVASQTLKGNSTKATVLVLRHGQPRRLNLHLYSFPILRDWDLTFIPEHDIRFADTKAGLDYWARLGRGFETAHNLEQALNAHLNALHNEPTNLDVALKVLELLLRIAHVKLKAQQVPEAFVALQQSTTLLERVFDHPLSSSQLQLIRRQLEEVLQVLRARNQNIVETISN